MKIEANLNKRKNIHIQQNFLDKEIGRKYELPALFRNPTKENPVEISEFLSHLNLSFLDNILQQIFPRLSRIKESVYARIRFVIFMTLKGIKFVKKAYREIEMNRKIAKNLGFNPNKIPSYETIRHFVFDLLPNKIEEIFYRIVGEIEKQLKKKGKWTGKVVEDATVIMARRGDEEAKYNGYYETYGWKKDLFIDSSNKIFLSYKDMKINENEGEYMKYHLNKLNKLVLE